MQATTNEGSEMISISPSVTYTQIDDGIVVLNIENGQYYGLNSTASYIYELLDKEPRTMEGLISDMVKEYDVAEDILRKDISAVIDTMKERGIVLVKSAVPA